MVRIRVIDISMVHVPIIDISMVHVLIIDISMVHVRNFVVVLGVVLVLGVAVIFLVLGFFFVVRFGGSIFLVHCGELMLPLIFGNIKKFNSRFYRFIIFYFIYFNLNPKETALKLIFDNLKSLKIFQNLNLTICSIIIFPVPDF